MTARQIYTAVPLLEESEKQLRADVKILSPIRVKKEGKFVSISELAGWYGCHRHTIRNRIHRIISEQQVVGYRLGDRMIPPLLIDLFVDYYGLP
jgi:hypothetical protein